MRRAMVLALPLLYAGMDPAALLMPRKMPVTGLSAGELALLPGIGPALAGRIKAAGGLAGVSGVGKKRVESLARYVSINP